MVEVTFECPQRSTKPPRGAAAKRRRRTPPPSPIGRGCREAPSDEEEQENSWKADLGLTQRPASPKGEAAKKDKKEKKEKKKEKKRKKKEKKAAKAKRQEHEEDAKSSSPAARREATVGKSSSPLAKDGEDSEDSKDSKEASKEASRGRSKSSSSGGNRSGSESVRSASAKRSGSAASSKSSASVAASSGGRRNDQDSKSGGRSSSSSADGSVRGRSVASRREGKRKKSGRSSSSSSSSAGSRRGRSAASRRDGKRTKSGRKSSSSADSRRSSAAASAGRRESTRRQREKRRSRTPSSSGRDAQPQQTGAPGSAPPVYNAHPPHMVAYPHSSQPPGGYGYPQPVASWPPTGYQESMWGGYAAWNPGYAQYGYAAPNYPYYQQQQQQPYLPPPPRVPSRSRSPRREGPDGEPIHTCRFFVSVDAEEEFGVVARIMGEAGGNLTEITAKSGGNAKVELTGRGSGQKEGEGEAHEEAARPLQLNVSCEKLSEFDSAKRLAKDLLERIYLDYEKWCKEKAKNARAPRIQMSEVLFMGGRDIVGGGFFETKHLCRFYIGIEEDPEFRVCKRLIGTMGCKMKEIVAKSGGDAKLRLRGEGSGYIEPSTRQESDEAMVLCLSCTNRQSYDLARRATEELLVSVYREYDTWCAHTGWAERSPQIHMEETHRIGRRDIGGAWGMAPARY